MLANLVIFVHLCFFVYVVGGFTATIIGVLRRESWVRNPWFRIPHFCAVLLVIIEDYFALECPLNVLENQFKDAPAAANPSPGFLEYLLHHTISEGALDILYFAMGAVLLILLFISRPRLTSPSSA